MEICLRYLKAKNLCDVDYYEREGGVPVYVCHEHKRVCKDSRPYCPRGWMKSK